MPKMLYYRHGSRGFVPVVEEAIGIHSWLKAFHGRLKFAIMKGFWYAKLVILVEVVLPVKPAKLSLLELLALLVFPALR